MAFALNQIFPISFCLLQQEYCLHAEFLLMRDILNLPTNDSAHAIHHHCLKIQSYTRTHHVRFRKLISCQLSAISLSRVYRHKNTYSMLRSYFIAVVIFLLIIGNDISRGGNNCLHSYRDIYHTMTLNIYSQLLTSKIKKFPLLTTGLLMR